MSERYPVVGQALEGAKLPGKLPLRCVECRAELHEGAPVTVLALRDAPGRRWRIDRVWSIGCAEHEFAALDLDLDLGAPAALAEGDVAVVSDAANQTHWPCLVRATVVDVAHGVGYPSAAMTDPIIAADDFAESDMTVAEAVRTDDAELLFGESTPRDDHSLEEFGGAATYAGP